MTDYTGCVDHVNMQGGHIDHVFVIRKCVGVLPLRAGPDRNEEFRRVGNQCPIHERKLFFTFNLI